MSESNNGLDFCPKCGTKGSLKAVSSAYVEQGPGCDRGYLFEGDADHLACSVCGYQFLDWQSQWPNFLETPGYLLLLAKLDAPADMPPSYGAYLVPASHAMALLTTYRYPTQRVGGATINPFEVTDTVEGVVAGLKILQTIKYGVLTLKNFFTANGVDSEFGAKGSSPLEALNTLQSCLKDSVVSAILNLSEVKEFAGNVSTQA